MSKHLVAENFQEILRCIAECEHVPQIFKRFGIKSSEFYHFVFSDPRFEQEYETARKIKSEMLVEQCLVISDDSEIEPNLIATRVKVRQWYASKMIPQKYGDRIDVNVNQPLDIAGAIESGRTRLRNNAIIKDAEVIEITNVNGLATTGSKPVVQIEHSNEASHIKEARTLDELDALLSKDA